MRPIRRLAISCAALLLGLLPAVLAAQSPVSYNPVTAGSSTQSRTTG